MNIKSLKDISDNITNKNFRRLSMHSYNNIRLYANDTRSSDIHSLSSASDNIRTRAVFKRLSVVFYKIGKIGITDEDLTFRHATYYTLNQISEHEDIKTFEEYW